MEDARRKCKMPKRCYKVGKAAKHCKGKKKGAFRKCLKSYLKK